MRIDKYLKVSRIIKRRTTASEMCSLGRVLVNNRPAKPSTNVEIGDIIVIQYNQGDIYLRVKELKDFVSKDEANNLYELIANNNDSKIK